MLGGLALAGCASSPREPAPIAAPVAPVTTEQGAQSGGFKIGSPYQIDGKWYYPAENYGYVEEGIASWYGQDFQGKRTANGERYDMNSVSAAHPTLPLPSMVKVTNLDNGRVLDVRVNDRGPFHSNRIIDLSRRAAQLLGFYDVGTAHVRVEIDPVESLNLKNQALQQHPPEMPQIAAAPREAISETSLAPIAVVASASEIAPTTAPAASAPADPSVTPSAVTPKPATKSAAAAKTPKKATPKTAAKPPTKSAPKTAAKPKQTETKIARANPGPEVPGIFVQAGAFSDAANAQRLEQQLSSLGNVSIVAATVNNVRLYRVRLGPIADNTAAEALLSRVKASGHPEATVVRE
jgi:rare lipoprotein A